MRNRAMANAFWRDTPAVLQAPETLRGSRETGRHRITGVSPVPMARWSRNHGMPHCSSMMQRVPGPLVKQRESASRINRSLRSSAPMSLRSVVFDRSTGRTSRRTATPRARRPWYGRLRRRAFVQLVW